MRILALDPALHTGVADGVWGRVAPALATWDLSEPHDNAPEAVFARAGKRLQLRLQLERPDALAIELPVPPHAMPGKTRWETTRLTLGLYGVYTGMAGAANVRVMPVQMQTWRKAALGQGGRLDRAAAKAAALRVCRLQGWETGDDDQAEAACIWMWACGAVRAGLLVGA